jgi:hypothetical protein
MAVLGDDHYPCIIYLREGGRPIGKVGPNMRQERSAWCDRHDAHKDPICSKNCLDVCVDYNNKVRENWTDARGSSLASQRYFKEVPATGASSWRGGVLKCTVCNGRADVTSDQCADYLSSGWPKCCGYTMSFTSDPTPKEGA